MRRPRPSTIARSGALGLALLLVSCGPPASEPGADPGNSPAGITPAGGSGATPSASPSTADPTPATESPTAEPAAGWTTYTTADGSLTFDHPDTWTLEEKPEDAAPGGVSVEVFTDRGKPAATLRTNMVTGAECTEMYYYSVVDSEPLPALAQEGGVPRFTFETRTDNTQTDPKKMIIAMYGITSGPEPTGEKACPIFHFFTWPPSGATFSGIYDPFDTTPGNPMHVDTPQAYTETPEYKDIKKMITSLRPAG